LIEFVLNNTLLKCSRFIVIFTICAKQQRFTDEYVTLKELKKSKYGEYVPGNTVCW